MKDKRQRQTFAWPYAAVYADPNFAASLLQAAATSVAMPYGYAPNPMLPQMPVMPTQMQQSAAVAAYSYGYRYAQYPIPPRSSANGVPHAPHAHQIPQNLSHNPAYPVLNSMGQGYTPLSIPKVQTPPSELMESPTSPESSLSLSPLSLASGKMNSPIKESNAHHGLLMTAPENNNHHTSHQHQHTSHHIHHQTNYEQTTIVKSEKPKLFKPYKSEE